MKKIYIIIAVALFLMACTHTGMTTLDEPIKIGAILGFTGNPYAFIAEAMFQGMVLAEEEINANGGIDGRLIKIIPEDDHFIDHYLTITGAEKLINSDNVVASIVGVINQAKPAAPVFNKHEIPLLVLWDDSEEFKNFGEYVFGTGFSIEYAAYDMADFAYDKSMRNIAIIKQQDEWSMHIGQKFAERFTQLGGTIVLNEDIPYEADFHTIITKSLSRKPDGIYAPLVMNLEAFLTQLQQLGYNGPVMFGDTFIPHVMENVPEAAESVYFTNPYISDVEKADKLKQAFINKYGQEPDTLIFVALGYDAVILLAEQAGKPGLLKENLDQVQGWQGVAGTVSFNQFGSAAKREKIFQVQNGEAVLVD